MAGNKKDTQHVQLVRDNTRLRVLAEVSHAFAEVGTDYRKLLDKIARITADLIGDACMVTLLEADRESLVNAASAHRDPNLERDYKTYLAGMRVSKMTSLSVSAQVAKTGKSKIANVKPEALVAQTDDTLKPIVARLNVHSYAVIPIRVHGNVVGTLSLLRSTPHNSYTESDSIMLQDLADRAGLAIDNARLYAELEQRVKQRTAELEISNKELEAFSYAVAHDLRAPLRSIGAFSQRLLDAHADKIGADGKEHLERVRSASKHMGELIDGLLNLSKITRSELMRTRVDLSQIAYSAIDRLREAHPDRNVDVVVETGLIAQADGRLMDIVLTNLIANAWKFTSHRNPSHIEFAAKPGEHGSPVYFVRDNGAGFDAAYAKTLFIPFHRLHTSAEFEGTGIGLATVQRIISRHGGKVWAEAELNKGATFYFTLSEDVP